MVPTAQPTSVANRAAPRVRPAAQLRVEFYLSHFPANDQLPNEGTSKAVHGLARALAALDADVTVLCEGPDARRLRSQHDYTVACFDHDAERAPWRSSLPPFRLAPGLRD